MKPTLIIIRGIPGSGKSTFAKILAKARNAEVFEADSYFIRDGVYVYDGEKIPDAHRWCIRSATKSAIERGGAIVANCDIRWSDLKETLKVCKKRDFDVEIYDVIGDFGSVHSVPVEKMDKLRQGFSLFPDLIKFFNRDCYDSKMIVGYSTVRWDVDGVPVVKDVPLNFDVEPAK